MQVLLGLACAASGANLIYILATHRPVAVIQSYALEIIALLVALALTNYNHSRSRSSSTILLLLWPLYAACTVVWCRTVAVVSLPDLLPVLALKCAVASIGLASCAFECLGVEFSPEDKPPTPEKGHIESPLLTANIFSIWTFSWMSDIMKKGAKAYLTEDDLPSLVPKDEAAKLGLKLQKAIQKQ